MLATATAQAAQGHVTLRGLVALAVIAYAVAAMLSLAPGPRALAGMVRQAIPHPPGQAVSGQDAEGTPSSECPDSTRAETPPGHVQPAQEPGYVSDRWPTMPPEPGDDLHFVRVAPSYAGGWGGRPIEQVTAARRAELGLPPEQPEDTGTAPVVSLAERAKASPAQRRAWLRARLEPGDKIAAQCKTRTDLQHLAAATLGADVRTIRRDLAHIARARKASQ